MNIHIYLLFLINNYTTARMQICSFIRKNNILKLIVQVLVEVKEQLWYQVLDQVIITLRGYL